MTEPCRPARSIVYFAYLGEEGTGDDLVRSRVAFMARQLHWLGELVAMSSSPYDVVVPYVAPRAWDPEVAGLIARLGFRIDPASILSDRQNRFEYPGFRALKALAEASAPDHLFYYCHSKGIVQRDESKMGLFRLHTEVGLTAPLDALNADPALTRACLFPYRFGWCWYNFFWVKGGYMARRAVEASEDRHHFEALIGNRGDRDGYRGVLPLIDRLTFEVTGIATKPWYRAEETSSPTLFATYDRYAAMDAPARPQR